MWAAWSSKMEYGMVTTQCQDTKWNLVWSLHSVKTQNGIWYDHYTVSRHKMEYGMITTQYQDTKWNMVWSLHSVKTQKMTHHLNKHHENLRTDFAKMGAVGFVLRMMGNYVTDSFVQLTCLYWKSILVFILWHCLYLKLFWITDSIATFQVLTVVCLMSQVFCFAADVSPLTQGQCHIPED